MGATTEYRDVHPYWCVVPDICRNHGGNAKVFAQVGEQYHHCYCCVCCWYSGMAIDCVVWSPVYELKGIMKKQVISTFGQLTALPRDVQNEMYRILTAVVISRGAKDIADVDVRLIAPEFDYAVFDMYALDDDMAGRLSTMIAGRLYGVVDTVAIDMLKYINS